MKTKQFISLLSLLIIISAAFMACAPSQSGPELEIVEVWGRPSPLVEGNGAIYMQITNTGDEDVQLIGAASDAAKMVELHMTTMDDGIMNMEHIESLLIPAGETVELKPGGYHVMLMNITDKLVEGNSISVTLQFDTLEDITLEAAIRNE